MLERVICLVTGYLLGSIIQAGYWYGRFKHIDIRKYGSGNAGTTNVMRTLGKKAGMTTYLFDALKPIMCMAIIHFVFGNKNGNELLLMMYGGLGVVLGHNFPLDATSDIKRFLKKCGCELREITTCDTWDKYEKLGEANIFLSIYPTAKYGAQTLAKRLGREHIYMPASFDYEEIKQQMERRLFLIKPEMTIPTMILLI